MDPVVLVICPLPSSFSTPLDATTSAGKLQGPPSPKESKESRAKFSAPGVAPGSCTMRLKFKHASGRNLQRTRKVLVKE